MLFVLGSSDKLLPQKSFQVFMHEARREKTWEAGSKKSGCEGAKEELRKLGCLE